MKIRLYSDIHLEFAPFVPDLSAADIFVFAGDLHVGLAGIKWLAQLPTDRPIIYVLGNHEFYKHKHPKLIEQIKLANTKPNIHILENESIVLDGVTFHGATLWTDMLLFPNSDAVRYQCGIEMNDYKKIRTLPNYSKMTTLYSIDQFNQSKKFLERALSECGGKQVVVTHHAPSKQSVPLAYLEDLTTAAYASDLEWLILKYQPELWLHGHIHNQTNYKIGNTHVLANPRGYEGHFINADFESDMLIQI